MENEYYKSLNNLTRDVKKFRIFIDTCSLLQGELTYMFFRNIVPILEEANAKLLLPAKCLQEIDKIARSGSDKSEEAYKVIENLRLYKKYIDVRYDKGEGERIFADNTFLSVFTMYRDRYNLLLITQDKNLAKDVLQLNKSRAVKGTKEIAVRRINKYGFLSLFDWQYANFHISTEITNVPEDPIVIPYKPAEGDIVYTDDGPIKLKKLLGTGGEGSVYETDQGYVAKIYSSGKVTERKYRKILKIIDKELKCDGICFPTAVLYTKQRDFIGYLMPRAKGLELGKSVFIKPLLKKYFPEWKKKDLVQLGITILNKIKYLHTHNIIMGDINPQNILVVSPQEVYFVDTDSYQIESFPCPVGTAVFTPPEMQGKRYSEVLRTIGNENFAVATLLFMILVTGKQPYAQQDGKDQITNIREMDFSYPCGEKSNRKTPDGAWGYIWSHLPKRLKEAFYLTFMRGEQYSTEQTRLGVDEWLLLFKQYFFELTDPAGKMLKNDIMSSELYPSRHKKSPNRTYIFCRVCKTEVDQEYTNQGLCRACLEKPAGLCEKCGKEVSYTNYHKYVKKIDIPKTCKACYEASQAIRPRVEPFFDYFANDDLPF